jgi:hypothetical protein
MGNLMRFFITTSVAGAAIVVLLGHSSWGNVLAGNAGESEWLQIARPLDIPSERLERPRPEQDRLSRPPLSPTLSQAEVIKLAKAEARKELGKRFNDYEIKSVIFESSTGLWSVTFDRHPPRRSPDGCVVVFVHDKDKTTNLQHCT